MKNKFFEFHNIDSEIFSNKNELKNMFKITGILGKKKTIKVTSTGDSQYLFVGLDNGEVKLMDIREEVVIKHICQKRSFQFNGKLDFIKKLIVSPDGKWLYVLWKFSKV